MKIARFLVFLAVLAICTRPSVTRSDNPNTGLAVGETVPNPEFTLIQLNVNPDEQVKSRLYDYKQDNVLLIAFIPSLNANYADIMTSAFDTYFYRGLSFRSFEKYSYENPELHVILVTRDDPESIYSYLNSKQLTLPVVSDRDMNMFNLFGINFNEKNENGSYVYIVDKDNKVAYADYEYKAQGEKLKSVQGKLYSMFDLKEDLETTQYSPLITGDDERDFYLQPVSLSEMNSAVQKDGARLSDYIGKKNVLIAFYPAAYSYSCSAEISTLDHWAEDRMLEKVKHSSLNNDDLEILMVSISNSYILSKWKSDLGLMNVKLVNDFDGEISQKYNSYNSFGYNKRTVFLIDKEGRVSYINWDYKVDQDDFELLKDNVMALK